MGRSDAANGVFDLRSYGVGRDASAALRSAIDDASDAGGGSVFIPPGSWHLSGPVTVTSGSVSLTGIAGASRLLATAEMPHMVEFAATGDRLGWNRLSGLVLDGGDKAVLGVRLDSCRLATMERLLGLNLTDRLLHVTSDQASWSEFISVRDCETIGGQGFASVSAGATGSCSDVSFTRCHARAPVGGWAFELDDVQRCVVEHSYAGNNSGEFAGVVRITAAQTAAGSPTESGQHDISNVYLENLNGSGAAVAVQIDAPAGSAKFLRWNSVRGVSVTPFGRAMLRMSNDGSTGIVRDNDFVDPRTRIGATGHVVIGAGCAANRVSGRGAVAFVDDSGTNTVLNLTG